jgi:hypothetical protein
MEGVKRLREDLAEERRDEAREGDKRRAVLNVREGDRGIRVEGNNRSRKKGGVKGQKDAMRGEEKNIGLTLLPPIFSSESALSRMSPLAFKIDF